VQEKDGTIRPAEPVNADHPNWSDYSNLTISESVHTAGHPLLSYRQQLHKQIIEGALASIERYHSQNPACILTHGGIASGKTAAIERFLSAKGLNQEYFHIDFDKMKKELPEYKYMQEQKIRLAASFVQSESAKLAGTLLKKAIGQNANVIYEGSLCQLETIEQRIRQMRRRNYRISVISTHVSEEKGQHRAITRFEQGGRYVPPEAVSGTYKKCPGTLVALKTLVDDIFLIDNNEDAPSKLILMISDGVVEEIDKELYNSYLGLVGNGGSLL